MHEVTGFPSASYTYLCHLCFQLRGARWPGIYYMSILLFWCKYEYGLVIIFLKLNNGQFTKQCLGVHMTSWNEWWSKQSMPCILWSHIFVLASQAVGRSKRAELGVLQAVTDGQEITVAGVRDSDTDVAQESALTAMIRQWWTNLLKRSPRPGKTAATGIRFKLALSHHTLLLTTQRNCHKQ